MRVGTAFKRLLRLPGASIIDVAFATEGVIVTVRLRRRRRVCASCGQTGRQLQIHDRRLKRWRHLDLGRTPCIVECELRRLRCPDCGVRLEPVPWARAGSPYTRDFEDVVAWLAQQMAKTQIAGLLRIAWDSVGRIVARVMADRLDERRLDGLVAIGVDEISYRRGQRYLTCVADHASGAIVWCAPGRNSATLQAFFDDLGERRQSIRAVSIDMSGEYQRAIRQALPHAQICFDPFHVCRLASRATDQVRRDEWNAHERSHTPTGRWVKGTRWSLLKAPDRQTVRQLATLGQVQHANRRLYRAFLLREELRLLYHLDDPRLAPAQLDAWLAWAARSRLTPFVALARTLRAHRQGILAAIRLGLSNGRLEGLNSKIRLISHRSFGLHSAAALIALIYLCCTATTIALPR
ncbi:MAG TPA: ISL3 family transposase [Gaiellales bacterium]|nr:ISL3 family transposase [Gaiellales bacterium]